MKKFKIENLRFILIGYIILIFVIFIVPLLIYDENMILKHTVSTLGSQNIPNSWIMNITFIIVG